MTRKTFSTSKGIVSFAQALIGLVLLVAFILVLNALLASRGFHTAGRSGNIDSQPPSSTLPVHMDEGKSPDDSLYTSWKLYKDPVYSYTFRYPSNWYLYPTSTEGMGGTTQLFSYDRDTFPTRGGIPIPRTDIKVEIAVRDNPKRLNTIQWLKKSPSNAPYQVSGSARNITVDGNLGLEFLNTRDGYSWLELYVVHEDKLYTFLVSPSDSDLLPNFHSILNLFNFPRQ